MSYTPIAHFLPHNDRRQEPTSCEYFYYRPHLPTSVAPLAAIALLVVDVPALHPGIPGSTSKLGQHIVDRAVLRGQFDQLMAQDQLPVQPTEQKVRANAQ